VNIMYWNIFHNFAYQPRVPFAFDGVQYHVHRADMVPGEDEPAVVPEGYTLVSLPRKPLMNGSSHGGGVALLIRGRMDQCCTVPKTVGICAQSQDKHVAL
jgi:hypothetical protein